MARIVAATLWLFLTLWRTPIPASGQPCQLCRDDPFGARATFLFGGREEEDAGQAPKEGHGRKGERMGMLTTETGTGGEGREERGEGGWRGRKNGEEEDAEQALFGGSEDGGARGTTGRDRGRRGIQFRRPREGMGASQHRRVDSASCPLLGDLAARGVTCTMLLAVVDGQTSCGFYDGFEVDAASDTIFQLGLVPEPPMGTSVRQLCPFSCGSADRARRGSFCPMLSAADTEAEHGCDASVGSADDVVERILPGSTRTLTWQMDTSYSFDIGVPSAPMPDPKIAHSAVSGRTKMLARTHGWG